MIGNIFNFKRLKKNKDGEDVIDMAQRSIIYKNDKIEVVSTLIVTKKFQMRPDLISMSAWGSTNDADLLMKYNGVSNPFSIEEGDLFVVPSLEQMRNNLYVPAPETITQEVRTKKQLKNIEKKKYNDRKKAADAKSGTKAPALGNSPNIANPGDQEIVYKDGKVIFGPNVTRDQACCDQPLAKSEFLAKIVKKRIEKNA